MKTIVKAAALGLSAATILGCSHKNTEHSGQQMTEPHQAEQKKQENDALAAYQRPGFVVEMVDGRLWVFRENAPELDTFQSGGELAKHVTRPAAGPNFITLKAPDSETIDEYLNAQQ